MDVGMRKIRNFEFGPSTAEIVWAGDYRDGTPAYDIYVKGARWCRLTVFVAGATLSMEEGDILVKTWSENERTTDILRKSGLFIDTGRRVPTGFTQAEIWRWKE
jgi:hypothetical protein